MVEGEGVLLHLQTGAYYSLNEVGSRVWELCNGKNSAEQIRSTVCAEYPSDPAVVRRDVEQFFARLLKEKLVEFAK